jgi:hypothetical protein
MQLAGGARPHATTPYPGEGCHDGAIGAVKAQRASHWTAGADHQAGGAQCASGSSTPLFTIVPDLPPSLAVEKVWADQDEAGDPRLIATIGRAAVIQTADGELNFPLGASQLTATLTATEGYPQAIPSPRGAGGEPDLGSVFLPWDSGRRPSLGVVR